MKSLISVVVAPRVNRYQNREHSRNGPVAPLGRQAHAPEKFGVSRVVAKVFQ
jgi:hypothetical protein